MMIMVCPRPIYLYQMSAYKTIGPLVSGSFLPSRTFVTYFSACIIVKVIKVCIHLSDGKAYCVKESQNDKVYFAFFKVSYFHLLLLNDAWESFL